MGRVVKALQYLVATIRGVDVPTVKGEVLAGETIQAQVFAPAGDNSPPLPDDLVFFSRDRTTGGMVYLGTLDQANTPQAEAGEKLLYARNAARDVITYAWFKKDGTLELNGAADFAVAFTDLQTKLSALEAQLVAHVHPGVTAGAASTLASVTAFDIDISTAKVPTVKLP